MSNKTEFVHLHVHSDYSLCNSTAAVQALADRAEEFGMKHLALTDHGTMFGVMDFIAACRKRDNPINPIIGCEVYVTPGSRFEKNGKKNERTLYHLALLAANRKGYFNLVKLCSLAYTEGYYFHPRVDDELLNQYHEGLIALSGCAHGEIPQLILEGKIEKAEQKACYYRDLFGDNNFYLEMQDQEMPAQQELNAQIADISQHTGIPLVATNNVHYIEKEDAAAHDVLLCIGQCRQRNDENRKKFYGDQFYFKSADEMAILFSGYPDAIANTVKIAERCVCDIPQVTLMRNLSDYLPRFAVPRHFASAEEYLCHIASAGLAKRYFKEKEDDAQWNVIQKRLDYELTIIIKMDFSDYFLIVADYVNWAREHDIPAGPGRGSAAGSIVAYSLGITDIDPLQYDLLFERFINFDRVSMPDIDIDFGNEGRDEVITYVTEKYGKDCVGQIVTFGTMNAKAVIKDVSRTLDISIKETEKITSLIPFWPSPILLSQAIDEEPKLREMESDPKYAELFTLAKKLEGLHRHSSIHAAGLVISKNELHTIVPLFKDTRTGSIATQYDMTYLEKCGLVKFDFLGLKTLDIIKHTEVLIRNKGGKYANFSIKNIPEDDKATFALFTSGDTDGVFLFESDGIKEILKRVRPEKIEDLMALNALYRPGPMKYIDRLIAVKNGQKEVEYPDPDLEDILKETYGIIVYQEQVMRIIQRVTGLTLCEADSMRRNFEKGDYGKSKFIELAIAHGFDENNVIYLFNVFALDARYTFNKSHAAAYVKLAYQTAYLKAHFPNDFETACGKYLKESIPMPTISGLDTVISTITDLHGGKLVLIGSRPSGGKTLMALHLLIDLMKHKIPSCFFSLEMSTEALKKRVSKMNIDLNNNLVQIIDKLNINMDEIESIIKNNELNAKYYFIDYLGLVQEEKHHVLKTLKSIALDLNVTIIVLTQLIRDNNPPGLNHFDSLYQYTDLIFGLQKSDKEIEVITLKGVK